MPALDFCHDQIVRALIKDSWFVNTTPRIVSSHLRTVHIDIEANRTTNGRPEQILLAEVKCFADSNSTTRELYTAIGQYLVYRAILIEENINIPLYLVLPQSAFETIFDVIVQRVVESSQIKLIIVNLEAEEIVRWKE